MKKTEILLMKRIDNNLEKKDYIIERINYIVIKFLNTNDIKNNGSFFQNESPLRLKYFTPYYDHTNDTFFLFYKKRI